MINHVADHNPRNVAAVRSKTGHWYVFTYCDNSFDAVFDAYATLKNEDPDFDQRTRMQLMVAIANAEANKGTP